MIVYEDAREDEMLYSVLARTLATLVNVAPMAFRELAFGVRGLSNASPLPNRLDQLMSSAQGWTTLTADRMIEELTQFRYHAAFWSSGRQEAMRLYMRSDGSQSRAPAVPTRQLPLTFNNRSPALKRVLYCCPKCIENDRAKYGEAHHHRTHQLESVWICPEHNVFLEATTVQTDALSLAATTYVTLEKALEAGTQQNWFTSVDTQQRESTYILAKNSAWLLNYISTDYREENWLAPKMKKLLDFAGYLTQGGRLQKPLLYAAVFKKFQPAVLRALGFPLDQGRRDPWLTRVMRSDARLHPTCYLIVMQAVGVEPSVFFNGDLTPPLKHNHGAGPWPCLNRVSDHYEKQVIYQHPKTTAAKTGHLFCCPLCEYEYFVGNGQSFESASIRKPGPVFENRLRELAADTSMTKNRAAKILGLRGDFSIKQICRSLGIERWAAPIMRPTDLRRFGQGSRWQDPLEREQQERKKLETCKALILEAIQDDPNVTRTLLEERFNKKYVYVYKRDPDWLAVHLPAREVSNTGRIQRSLNSALDLRLSLMVDEIANDLRSARDPVRRVTRYALTRRLDHPIYADIEIRFPLTAQIIEKHIEDEITYQRRRMSIVAEDLLSQGILKRPSQLTRSLQGVGRREAWAHLAEEIFQFTLQQHMR